MQADRILVRLRQRRFARRDDPLPRRLHVTGVRGIGSQRTLSPPAKALRATGLWTRSDAGRRMRAGWPWVVPISKGRTGRNAQFVSGTDCGSVGSSDDSGHRCLRHPKSHARRCIQTANEANEAADGGQRPGRETPFVPGNSLS
jgi:hypothetical protein